MKKKSVISEKGIIISKKRNIPESKQKVKQVRMIYPRLYPASLKRFNLETYGKYNTVIRCTICGRIWMPYIEPNGRLSKKWWSCENCQNNKFLNLNHKKNNGKNNK